MSSGLGGVDLGAVNTKKYILNYGTMRFPEESIWNMTKNIKDEDVQNNIFVVNEGVFRQWKQGHWTRKDSELMCSEKQGRVF